jgi:hypothetical protein
MILRVRVVVHLRVVLRVQVVLDVLPPRQVVQVNRLHLPPVILSLVHLVLLLVRVEPLRLPSQVVNQVLHSLGRPARLLSLAPSVQVVLKVHHKGQEGLGNG